jgi:hypothetical protein
LLEITPKLKRYFWQKLKLKKTQILSRTTIEKQVSSSVPEVRIAAIAINNHMAVIQVQIWKNTIEDVLFKWIFWS